MKTVKWRKSFKKDYNRLNQRQQEAWAEAFDLLIEDPYARVLRRHKVSGKYAGLESIDVMPDLRALFLGNNEFITFYYIGNHNQLY